MIGHETRDTDTLHEHETHGHEARIRELVKVQSWKSLGNRKNELYAKGVWATGREGLTPCS